MAVASASLLCLCGGGVARAAAPPPPDASTTLDASRAGEAVMALTARAPGTDWGARDRESAVATVSVDGRYSQDVVLFEGARRFTYRLGLGRLGAGRHRIAVRFDAGKSPAGARGIAVDAIAARVAPPAAVYERAPILYGRDLSGAAGPFENNHTDVPLLLYHRAAKDAAGYATITYSMIWSNEDGGTPAPALMARWGRTTDIEWIYRVRLDPRGRRLQEWYRDPRHRTLRFAGAHEGSHPLLETVTASNGVMPVVEPARATRFRFSLDPSSALGPGQARETMLDARPWIYELSSAELVREGKVESVPSPWTAAVSDVRDYLFVRLGKLTTYAGGPPARGWVGTAVEVRLRGGSTWYRSDHGLAAWSVKHDGPLTTAVELPPGTLPRDVLEVRTVAEAVHGVAPGWRVRVSGAGRAFLLGADYRPSGPFLKWHRRFTLTSRRPSASLAPG